MNFPLGKSRMHLQKTRFLEANIFIRQANYGGRKKVYLCGGFNTPTLCIATNGIKPDCITLSSSILHSANLEAARDE